MTTFGERIKHLRFKINISQKQLAEDLGYKTFTTVSKWESDSSLPPGKELIKLATYFNVTTDYLLGLANQPVQYSLDDIQNTVDLSYFNSFLEHYTHVNEETSIVEDEEPIPTIEVPNHVLVEDPEHYFVTKVRTDSMNRLINDGDYIVVLEMNEAELSELHTGDILVVKIEDDFKIEILRKTDSMIYLEPNSYLDGFETMVLSLEDFEEVEVIGKIVYSFRQFNQAFHPDFDY